MDHTTGLDQKLLRDGPSPAGPHSSQLTVRQVDARAIPGYEILGELGRGGMGVVYRARQVRLNRPCAVKMILAGAHATPEAAKRFLAEAEAIARLEHPHIVRIHHIGEADGLPFFELELVPGGSLDRRLDGAPWPPERAARLAEKLASAIAEAHRQGIVHRDLKPGNVLLAADDTPKITDFGLAKAVGDESGLTATEAILGSPSYMAPEQAGGRAKEAGPAADIYALGAILYELLTGRPPFRGATLLETLEQVKSVEPVPPSQLAPRLPKDIETICLKCLQKDPHRRYESAAALAEDVHRFLAGAPIAARPVGWLERAWRWRRRNPVVAGLAAAVLLVFAAGFAGIAWKWRDAERQKSIAQDAERAETRQRKVAVEQASRANREADHARGLLYASDLTLAYQAWEAGDTGRARDLLERQRPPAGKEEFEWRYLWRRCQDASQATLRGHNSRTAVMIGLTTLSMSKDGRTLATIGEDCSVCLWDIPSRRHIKILMSDVAAVALSPDGKLLALGRRSAQSVHVWDTITHQEVASLPARAGVMSLNFSPDGKLIAAGCYNGVIRFWEGPEWRELPLNGATPHRDVHGDVLFSPDGKTLATASEAGALALWDVETRQVRAQLEGNTSKVVDLSFSPDGKTLAAASEDGIVRFWDAASGQSVPPQLRLPGVNLGAIAYTPDGKSLAAGAIDGTIRILDTATKTPQALLRGHDSPVMAVAYAPDGQTLYSLSFLDGALKIWDLTSRSDADLLTQGAGIIYAVEFSPVGRTLAVPDQDGSVKLWDPASRTITRRLAGHPEPVSCLAYSPDGRTLAAADNSKKLLLWDVATGKTLAELQHANQILSLGFSKGGRFVAAAEIGSGDVHIWNIAQRRKAKTVSGTHAKFSPDGRLLAVALNNTVQLWETSSWRPLSPLTGFTAQVHRLAFSPDGKKLVAGDHAGTVWLWDMVNRRSIANRRAHATTVESVAFSPNGRRIATAGYENAVKLWDAALLQEVATFNGHEGYVTAVAFSSDGDTLASASADATVRLWQAPPLDKALRSSRGAAGLSSPVEVIHRFGLYVMPTGIKATHTTVDQIDRVDVTATGEHDYDATLGHIYDDLQEGATYSIRFRARASSPRRLKLYGQVNQPDWHPIGLNHVFDLTTEWQTFTCTFQAKDVWATNNMNFMLGEQTGTVWIADFTLTRQADSPPIASGMQK